MSRRTIAHSNPKMRKIVAQLCSVFFIAGLFVADTSQIANAAPSIVPTRAKAVTANAGDGSATVSWSAPSNSGSSAVTGYLASTEDGSFTCQTTSATTCTITGLTNGVGYRFIVTASNSAGSSVASTPSKIVTPLTVSSAPEGITTLPGIKTVKVSWLTPSSNGGSAIKGYVVTSSPENKTCKSNQANTCTVRGLTAGQNYVFSVAAINKAGSSQLAYSLPTAPLGLPSAPTSVTSNSQGGSIAVSWGLPQSTGGSAILRYQVTSSPAKYNCTTTNTSCTFGATGNGTKYIFNVVAINAIGKSPVARSGNTITNYAIAQAPTSVIAVAGENQASVSWTAPTSNGGSEITSYTVTSTPGGLTCTTPTTSCVVSGLNNYVNYTFSVTATNAVGTSVRSSNSQPIMPGSRTINNYLVYPGANLAGANLANANLSGVMLTGVNFAGANLEGVDLSTANLTGTNLAGANLRTANLTNANLVGANLIGANLISTNLSGTNLSGTNLSFTTLAGTDLSGTNLTGTNLTGADLTEVNFFEANLTGTNLTGSNLTRVRSGSIQGTPLGLPQNWKLANGYLVGPSAYLSGANLVGANLEDANFSGVNLEGANLEGANLDGAVLNTANLNGIRSGFIVGTPSLPIDWTINSGYLVGPGANLAFANLPEANLTSLNLEGADLTGAYLIGASLVGANLNGTKLYGAILIDVQSGYIWGDPYLPSGWAIYNGYLLGAGANLMNAELSGIYLSGVSLEGANLSGANLTYANFARVNLSFANLVGANLDSALMVEVNLTKANLFQAFLFNTNFIYSDLTGVNLEGANLNGAILEGILTGVRSGNTVGAPAYLPREWTFQNGYLIGPGATLVDANLQDAYLGWVNLTGANLYGANLNQTHLEGAILTGVKSGGLLGMPSSLPDGWVLYAGYLVGAGADLQGAILTGAYLDGINLEGARLEAANLDFANLNFANLRGVSAGGASLFGANLVFANLYEANLVGVNLNSADLSMASLSLADLSFANLSNSNLSFADLSFANLQDARLEGAYMSGANFTGAIW